MLQLRFLAYKRLTDNTLMDSNGVTCSQQDSKYSFNKLRMKVSLYGLDDNDPNKIRKALKQYDIPLGQGESIDVGACSSILTSPSIEVPSDSDRFVLSIDNIYWDFFCENEEAFGTDATTVCPDYQLPPQQCVKIGIQVATDSTFKFEWRRDFATCRNKSNKWLERAMSLTSLYFNTFNGLFKVGAFDHSIEN